MAHTELTGAVFLQMLATGTDYLERNKQKVNALNVFPVPDGDTGTNMSLTLAAARREFTDDGQLSLGEVTKRVARGVLLGARGNSGVILSQFLRGFAQGLSGRKTAGPKEVAYALVRATETAYRAVIKPVEGTMLTVGKGASEHATNAADRGADLRGVLEAAVRGAEEALARTPDLLPVLAKAGVVDAGGQGLVYFLTGALLAVRGEQLPPLPRASEDDAPKGTAQVPTVAHGAIVHEEVTYCYCTEFLIRGRDLRHDVIQARVENLGDSLLVVGDTDLVKVHVHTDHPGRVLEIALEYGELLEISIDNMQEQNRLAAASASAGIVSDGSVSDAHGETASAPAAGAIEPAVALENGRATGVLAADVSAAPSPGHGATTATAVENSTSPADLARAAAAGQSVLSGVVAVAPGTGWEQLFRSLGIESVVSGGQTMNPSAAELVEAIEAVAADDVIVMPNNSNILFAARQAQELTTKRVHIIETTTAPQSVAAMMAYNPEGEPQTVAADMAEAAEQLRTAEITHAVRDSDAFEDGIKAGDILALIDGDIRIVGDTPENTAVRAVEQLMDDDASLVSVYYGSDVDAAAAGQLAERIRREWPACEVEVYDGGQPVYYYILSVE